MIHRKMVGENRIGIVKLATKSAYVRRFDRMAGKPFFYFIRFISFNLRGDNSEVKPDRKDESDKESDIDCGHGSSLSLSWGCSSSTSCKDIL